MRVKVGNTWYEATPTDPIQVEFTQQDLQNIKDMPTIYTRYAYFHPDTKLTIEQRTSWSLDGATVKPRELN
jgi:hypothetical protein